MEKSFRDEALLAGPFYRGKIISQHQLKHFPHNCIGLVQCTNAQKYYVDATGFLINSCIVLTAAHNLLPFKQNQLTGQRTLMILKPFQFCLNLHGQESTSTKIAVVNFRYPKQFEDLYRKMEKLKKNSPQYLDLVKQSIKYDYAILKLQKNIERDIFPALCTDLSYFNKRVMVCGYANYKNNIKDNNDYRQSYHSNPLQQPLYKIGGIYNIDTITGQSGSPVYFMEKVNGIDYCCVVGIHKGYDEKLNKNVCLLLSKDMIKCFQDWIQEMSLSLLLWKNNSQKFSSPLEEQVSQILKVVIQQHQIDSEILLQRDTANDDIKFISESLCHPSNIQLIFRASEHDFSASKFHYFCDNVKNTLIIALTQFDKIIVGYSYHTWKAQEEKNLKRKIYDGGYEVIDKSRRAFLLLLDLRQKLVPQIDEGIITCDSSYGPIFGTNAFRIANMCSSQASSTTMGIGGSYNGEGSGSYAWTAQETFTASSGAKQGDNFAISEYEVFKIQWCSAKFKQMIRMTNKRVDQEFNRRKINKQLTQFDQWCLEQGYKK